MIEEFIYQCRVDLDEIKLKYPSIDQVNFELLDVPLAEMKKWAKENKANLKECNWKDSEPRLVMFVSIYPGIIVYSKKLLVSKPELVEELEEELT